MVTVKLAETFDLSSAREKLGLIGIHTPPRALLERHYGGLMNNYKFIRFKKCDVYFASVATLPLDPLAIGVSLGQVNPSDIMNPVLYKAVSNDSWETVIARIYGGYDMVAGTDGSSVTMAEGLTPSSDPPVGMTDFGIYYGILSNSPDWRKAMPQVGFEMHGLTPLMYALLLDMGPNAIPSSNDKGYNRILGNTYEGGGNSDSSSSTANVTYLRGRPSMAPPFPLWSGVRAGANPDPGPVATSFPKTFVGAIIVPPCHTSGTRLYYRLRIVWTVEFVGLTSHQNISTFLEMNNNGIASYLNNYTAANKSLEDSLDVVDSSGFKIEKVMEGAS